MSAIAGILHFGGRPVDRHALGRMCDAAAAAGPDGRGVWVDGCVGLAHCLLVTTPESRGERQPLSLNGHVWISADARIDNRTELIDALCEVDGVDRGAVTDGELILRAYELWGLDCLPRLMGDFAFVIWDGRRQQVLAVRDYFGIRPLHYFLNGRGILLASSISQILADPSVPRTLNDETVEDWLLTARRKRLDATFYKGIKQVPAGQYLLVNREGNLRVRPYWKWREPRPIRYRSQREYAEHLYWVFREAVRARLRAVGPVGLFLSGGLDSSGIAGVAARVLREEGRPIETLRTYSFVFDETPECDERQYIEPLVKHLGAESVYLWPERYEAFAPGRAAGDEPDSSDAYDPAWAMALCDLRENGGRVMLTGFGGETICMSQSRLHFLDWFLAGRWRLLWRELGAYKREYNCWPGVNWLGVVSRFVPRPLYTRLPEMPWASQDPPWIRVTPEVRRRRVRRWRAGRAPLRFRSLAKQLAFGALAGDAEGANLWRGTAHQGRRVGIEYSHPFMDRRLHEFVYALPLDCWFDRALDRAVFREALKGLIPDSVRLRRSVTLFDQWIDSHPGDAALRQVISQLWVARVWPYLDRAGFDASGSGTNAPRDQLTWLALLLYWWHAGAGVARVVSGGHYDTSERSPRAGEMRRPEGSEAWVPPAHPSSVRPR